MAGKFEVYKDARGEFRFRLKAANGQIIASGEGYTTKAACMNGIESVRTNAANAVLDDKSVAVPAQGATAEKAEKAGADS